MCSTGSFIVHNVAKNLTMFTKKEQKNMGGEKTGRISPNTFHAHLLIQKWF